MPVFSWDRDRESIVAKVATPSTLKICTKVIDEPLLTEGWIQHHAKIVGFENLIIADNGSTDPYTEDIYRRYCGSVTIFKFTGSHNEIHWHPRFLDFFNVISKSSSFCTFLDIDERLVLLERDSWRADDSIVNLIKHVESSHIIPTTWLINSLNRFDRFSLLDSEYTPQLKNNLKWGKPIFPGSLTGIQSGIHNFQFDRFQFSTKLVTHLFLLHFTQLPERRIAANRNKLLSRGVIDKSVSNEDIMSMSFDTHPDKTLPRFVKEMRLMFGLLANQHGNEKCETDYLELAVDGEVKFSSNQVRTSFIDFLDNGVDAIFGLFGGSSEEELMLNNASSLLRFALDLRQRGILSRAETLFRRGMVLYPEFLDEYGGPAFRKELMRTFLARQEWDSAMDLSPAVGEPGGMFWHQILFARAYSSAGNETEAANWWSLVLKDNPENGEAKAYFRLT